MTKAIPDLTRAELLARIAKADALDDALCQEMIDAGRGHDLPSDIRKCTDDLSVRWTAARATSYALYSERAARLAYQGSAHRIVRAA